MDIGKAFGFVFEDEEWLKKVLIGAVVSLIPLVGQFLTVGYGMEVARRVVKGHPQVLPEWDDWGTKLMEGFMSNVIAFIWSLPLILIAGCIWIALIPIAGLDDSGEIVGVVGGILSLCVGLFALLYGLVLALIFPAAVTHYAATGQFGAAFRFGEIIGMVRDNLGVYLMVLVTMIIAGFVAGLGGIVVGCGALFTSFYALLMIYHAFGQAYRTAAGNVESGTEFAY